MKGAPAEAQAAMLLAITAPNNKGRKIMRPKRKPISGAMSKSRHERLIAGGGNAQSDSSSSDSNANSDEDDDNKSSDTATETRKRKKGKAKKNRAKPGQKRQKLPPAPTTPTLNDSLEKVEIEQFEDEEIIADMELQGVKKPVSTAPFREWLSLQQEPHLLCGIMPENPIVQPLHSTFRHMPPRQEVCTTCTRESTWQP